ncbi:outer membrane beta-barrel family protein, partial [Flavihumibacter sediminis]|nr:outer membrane beta-barrel family protein [Flavihumibacter sediminis]
FTIQTGRRINRPAYQQLNPFLFFINEYTYQVGNPYIQPQFTWNFQFSHTYKGWLTTSLEYGDTKQYFSQIFKTEGRVTILTEGNLANMKNLNLSLTAQLKPAKWWSATINLTGTYQKVNGVGMNSDF